jgi:purine catabolism regulator
MHMAEATEFTLGDLINTPELGLDLITGGPDAGARPVAGAQSSEIEHPTRWLDRDWVLLMAGVRLKGNATAERELIAELDERNITGLGFALNVIHPKIPPALIDEARQRDFPIFTVPLRTGFRDVIATVYRNVMSEEFRAAHRLASMQRFLMDAIGQESPDATVVERLRSLLGAKVGILREDGRMEPSTFQIDGDGLHASIGGRPHTAASFVFDDLEGLAFPIHPVGAPGRRWLVIATHAGRPLHPLARSAGHAAVPLFIAMSRLTHAQVEQDIALRRATLEALIEADDRQAAALASARARALGLDVPTGVVAVAVAVATTGAQVDRALIRSVERSFWEWPQALSVAREDHRELIGLIPAPASDRSLIDHILVHGPGLRVGVGRTVTQPQDVRQSVLDAELAAREGRQSDATAIIRYDDLDVGTVLLHEVSRVRLAPKIDAWIAPLRANRMFYSTVVAFMQNNLDVSRTARILRLHPNSVRYRLARAEDALGASLRSPVTIAALHVAFTLDEALPGSGSSVHSAGSPTTSSA